MGLFGSNRRKALGAAIGIGDIRSQAETEGELPPAPKGGGGFFGREGFGRYLGGALGDALANNAGMGTPFASAMQQRAKQDYEDQLYQRRSAQEWSDFTRKYDYEAAHPKQTPNDTERDYQFWKARLTPAQFDEWLANRVYSPPHFGVVDGVPAMIGGYNGGGASGGAELPPGFQLDGGAGPQTPRNFPEMTGITAQAESGNRDYVGGQPVTSPAGAKYAMQVMPETARQPGYGVRPAQNDTPEEYNRVGREYLAAMLKLHGGDPAKAWAAYNGGPGRLASNGGNINAMPAETQRYVQSNVRRLRGLR